MNFLIGLLYLFGPWAVLIASSWWVYNDLTKFRQLGVTKLSPGLWSILVFILWLPFFPIYFSLRMLVFKNKSKIMFWASVFLILILTEFAVYFLAKQLYYERQASVLTRQEANEKIVEIVEKSFEKNDDEYAKQVLSKQLTSANRLLTDDRAGWLDRSKDINGCGVLGSGYLKFTSPSTSMTFCFPTAWGKPQSQKIVNYINVDTTPKVDEAFTRVNFIDSIGGSPVIEFFHNSKYYKCYDSKLSDAELISKCSPRSVIRRFKLGEVIGFKTVSVSSIPSVFYIIPNINNSEYIFIEAREMKDSIEMDKMVSSIKF